MKGLTDGKAGLWLAVLMAAVALVLSLQGGNSSMESTAEKRVAEVLSAMAGAGRVEVALYYGNEEKTGTPTGALVVAQGAQDMAVRLNLIRAVRTLLGLNENAVDVFVMEEGT